MANVSMNIRTDSEIKKQAQQLFTELGMDMTTAVNIFLRQSIRSNGIPFEIKIEIPNKETRKAIKDVHDRCNLSGPFYSIESLMEDLNADN